MSSRPPRPSRARPAVLVATVAACLLALLVPRPARAASPAEVDAALERAKAYLYAQIKPGQFWEETPAMDEKAGNHDVKGRQWGGNTALAVYALLAMGERENSPQLKPAVEWIKKQRIVGNYALGIRAQIWPFLPPTRENQLLAMKDRDYLYKGVHRNPNPKKGDVDRLGFYPYWFNDKPKPGTQMGPGDSWWDLSVSQYGVLGMWACEQVEGVDVPLDYWIETDKAWRAAQYREGPDAGAWAYRRGGGQPGNEQEKPKATMAAAGVATLFITQDYLLRAQGSKFASCRGGEANDAIELGLAWMDKNVGQLLAGNYYGMYGVERIGLASGRKYFGATDWYEVGSNFLVRAQKKAPGQADDGKWGGAIHDHCFAILFLARGRSPVILNKLEYALPADAAGKPVRLPWAQRPRDVANFARYVTKQAERYYGWQVVNLKVSPDDLHDAPILYVAGSNPLAFDDAEVAKLREFVEAGGTILFNPDCGEAAFTTSVVGKGGLGQRMFPKYEFRELPPNHPLFTNQPYLAKNWKSVPKVLGMSNGVRELMIVAPDLDAGRAWQTAATKTQETAFQFGANLFYYASERGTARYRGDTHFVKVDPKVAPVARLRVARLMTGPNADPEPWGWKRMAGVLMRDAKVALTVEPVKPGEGKLAFAPAGGATGYQVAHLTGTGKFDLPAPQRDEIKKFVAAGGTLLVDAAGGDPDFASSAEKALAATFNADPTSVGPIVAPDEPLYTWAGYKVPGFRYREYAQSRLAGKLNVPRVRGIEVGGKLRVFYSREDLSFGLVGQPRDGIIGYAPDTATDVVRNLLLYATFNGKAPPRPTTGPAAATKPV
ncbi:MAG TPA: DUF4159 domain-containing protein, partial [Humisphaera sp.]